MYLELNPFSVLWILQHLHEVLGALQSTAWKPSVFDDILSSKQWFHEVQPRLEFIQDKVSRKVFRRTRLDCESRVPFRVLQPDLLGIALFYSITTMSLPLQAMWWFSDSSPCESGSSARRQGCLACGLCQTLIIISSLSKPASPRLVLVLLIAHLSTVASGTPLLLSTPSTPYHVFLFSLCSFILVNDSTVLLFSESSSLTTPSHMPYTSYSVTNSYGF